MLETEFPLLEQLELGRNTGGAGGFKAGMEWAHTQGYDWIWVMDDDLELVPHCLETMLQWQHVGDVIQVRKQFPWGPFVWEGIWDVSVADTVTYDRDVSFANGKKWTAVQYCNFEGALIKRIVVERAGLPDDRYFIEGDDTMYGYRAALHCNVIYVDFLGIIKDDASKGVPEGRLRYYLSIRNRFLTHQNLIASGLRLHRRIFLVAVIFTFINKFKGAARSTGHRAENIRALFQGLLDGLRGRFGPPPWIAGAQPLQGRLPDVTSDYQQRSEAM